MRERDASFPANPSPSLPIPISESARVWTHAREKHVGIPELSRRWGYLEDIIRRWFLEKPRPGVLTHSERKGGKREYVSLRISETAAAAVYAEKCGLVSVGLRKGSRVKMNLGTVWVQKVREAATD